jgi:predicted phosphodiesterase
MGTDRPEPASTEEARVIESARSGRWWHALRSVILVVAVGLVGSWAALLIAGSVTAALGPFEVKLDARFGPGQTTVSLPPLGTLTADTHTAPLRLGATLVEVRIQELADDLRDRGTQAVIDEVQAALPGRMRALAVRGAVVSALGALIVAVAVFRARWRLVTATVAASILIVGGTEATAFATYSPAAFRQPTFSGSLALAPQLIGPLGAATGRIDRFREELARVIGGAARVYASISASPAAAPDEVRVLHISDIHLSPLGMTFARQLASAFDVDFVLDTGDITSFGTPAEALILGEIPSFNRPYLFVRGNHDSIAIQNDLGRVGNAVVLDGQAVTERGILVYGLGDPVFTPNKLAGLDDAQIATQVAAVGPRIAGDIQALPRPPDIVAVHDDRMAAAVAGGVPLVVSGHFHQPSDTVVDGTLYLRIGSTGGAGANVFTTEAGVPLSAEILHFSPAASEKPPALVGWDLVTQSPATGNLTIERHAAEATAEESSPGLSPSVSPS